MSKYLQTNKLTFYSASRRSYNSRDYKYNLLNYKTEDYCIFVRYCVKVLVYKLTQTLQNAPQIIIVNKNKRNHIFGKYQEL